MSRRILLVAGLCIALAPACLQAQLLKKIGGNLKKSINDTAEKLVSVGEKEDKQDEEAPAVVEAAPAKVEEAAPAPEKKAADAKQGKFQPSVAQTLKLNSLVIDGDVFGMIKNMKALQSEFSLVHDYKETAEFVGGYRGINVMFYVDKFGVRIPEIKVDLKGNSQSRLKEYLIMLKEFKEKYGESHEIVEIQKRNLIKNTFNFWQYKNGMLLLWFQNAVSYEDAIAKELGKANSKDPRIEFDSLNEVFNLKQSAVAEFGEKINGGITVWYLTAEGIKNLKVLPTEPLELGKADEFFHRNDAKKEEGLDPNRAPVGEIPASIPKNAIFDIKTQSVVCYYKGQKFFADEACTEMLYSHPGNTVGTEHPVPYGKGLFRFASGRMYKENSYNNADVVGSIIEVRCKKGDVLEAKIFDKCVFARDVEKVDNDKGEDIYKFKLSWDNVERAEIPATYTYKEGKLYRGDSTEDRDCVMVIDPTLNSSRLLFVALTFVK
ncbi:MAG: hypothetical protein MJ202_09015 [Lentisphaeria bacterium]|nr:hypothetical protein [Lentisphaeria bacterium]